MVIVEYQSRDPATRAMLLCRRLCRRSGWYMVVRHSRKSPVIVHVAPLWEQVVTDRKCHLIKGLRAATPFAFVLSNRRRSLPRARFDNLRDRVAGFRMF